MVDVIDVIRGVLVVGKGFNMELGLDGLYVYRGHMLVWLCRVSGDRVLVYGAGPCEIVFLLASPGLFVDLQGSLGEACGQGPDQPCWGFRSQDGSGRKYGGVFALEPQLRAVLCDDVEYPAVAIKGEGL